MEGGHIGSEKNAGLFFEWIQRHLPNEDGEMAPDPAREMWNIGIIDNPDGRGLIKGICGDTMDISIRIENGVITDAKFRTNGCLSSQMCGSAATFLAKGEKIMDALHISPGMIMGLVSKMPGVEVHCSILAATALFRAIAEYL